MGMIQHHNSLWKPPIGVQLDKSHLLARGLVGAWLLNEGGGNRVNDVSGNGYHLTMAGTVPWAGGAFGPALDIPGTNYNYYQSATSVGTAIGPLAQFSAAGSCWLDTLNGNGAGGIFCLGTLVNSWGKLLWSDFGDVYVNEAAQSLGASLPTGRSVAWAVTYDGAAVRSYVNGVLWKQDAYAGGAVDFTGCKVVIGAAYRTYSYLMNGRVDWSAFYNRTLTASEVVQLARDPFGIYQRQRLELWTAALGGDPSILTVSATDSLGLTDSAIAELPILEITASDSLNLTEQTVAALSGNLSAAVTDTLDMADGAAGNVPVVPVAVSDMLGATDNVAVSLPVLQIQAADVLALSDNATANVPVVPIVLGDSLALADNATARLPELQMAVTDTLGVADNTAELLTPLRIGVTDTLALAESIGAATGTHTVIVINTLGLSESLTAQLTPLQMALVDSMDLADSAVVRLTPLAAEVTDALGLDDVSSIYLMPLTAGLTDQIALAETAVIETNPLQIGVSDALSLTETMAFGGGLILFLGMTGGIRDLCGGIAG